jgi:hypothetical protein
MHVGDWHGTSPGGSNPATYPKLAIQATAQIDEKCSQESLTKTSHRPKASEQARKATFKSTRADGLMLTKMRSAYSMQQSQQQAEGRKRWAAVHHQQWCHKCKQAAV